MSSEQIKMCTFSPETWQNEYDMLHMSMIKY